MSSFYDLEEQIMQAWSITSDLDMISEAVVENDLSKDQIANMIIGISELYNLKFQKLFRTFDSACFPQQMDLLSDEVEEELPNFIDDVTPQEEASANVAS